VADWLDDHDVFVRRHTEPPLDRLICTTVGPPAARAYLAERFAARLTASESQEA